LKDMKNAGADICLPKPFGLDEIQSAIEERLHASPSGHVSAASSSLNVAG
jgi:DNA-binding response OmpR family regulator